MVLKYWPPCGVVWLTMFTLAAAALAVAPNATTTSARAAARPARISRLRERGRYLRFDDILSSSS
jgi:hypothetical protein